MSGPLSEWTTSPVDGRTNMRFDQPQPPIAPKDIDAIETRFGIKLPTELRAQYLQFNGGIPDPYVFENYNLDTVVVEFLPIVAHDNKRTAVDVYRDMVLAKGRVGRQFFPFAMDGGGSYFCVDTASPNGLVYFYDGAGLIPLGVGIGAFWSVLKPEHA
jgi:hypothetical protein